MKALSVVFVSLSSLQVFVVSGKIYLFRLVQMEPMNAPPGSWFSEGRHCVQYGLYGLIDGKELLQASSLKQCFEVIVIRCPTLGKHDKIEYECGDKNIYQRGARYGSQCTFSCANGYELDGDILLTCKRDGTWDKPTPKCKTSTEMHCDIPELPDNMDVSKYDNVEGNKICFVKCKQGYRFEDEDTKKLLTCGHGGRWNMERLPKRCVKLHCGEPQVPANAHVSKCSESYIYGSTCLFACNPGYILPQEDRQFGNYAVCDQTGTWVAQTHACKKLQCGEPPVPENAHVSKCSESYYYESTCVFACDSGYELPQEDWQLENYAVCDQSGTWVTHTHACEIIRCGVPPVPENAHVSKCSASYYFESKCVFACDSGYELPQDNWQLGNYAVCDQSGKWISQTQTCGKLQCGEPPVPANAYVSKCSESYYYESKCVFACDSGYELPQEDWQLENYAVCDKTGTWITHTHACEIIQCGEPPVPENAHVSKCSAFYHFESKCVFACNPGYEFPQEDWHLGKYAVCDQTGTWVAQTQTCGKLQCGEPPVPANAHVSKCSASYYFESKCVFACDSGYELPQQDQQLGNYAVCDPTGTWVAQTQTCGKIQCPKLNRNEQCSDGYNVGSMCTQDCGQWLTVFTNSIKCAHNGSWVGEFESCNEYFSLKLFTGVVAVFFPIGILVHRSVSTYMFILDID